MTQLRWGIGAAVAFAAACGSNGNQATTASSASAGPSASASSGQGGSATSSSSAAGTGGAGGMVHCNKGSDCPKGQACVMGQCGPCSQSGDCDAGQICTMKACGPCSDSKDCAMGQACLNGACTACPMGQTGCGTSCVALDSDPKHCGACGTDCTATVKNVMMVQCNKSSCGYDACAMGYSDCDGDSSNGCETMGNCTPVLIATADATARQVAVDDSYVYWTVSGVAASDGKVYRAKKDGVKQTGLTPLYANLPEPDGIDVDATTVYWGLYAIGGDGTIRSAPKDGSGMPKVVATTGVQLVSQLQLLGNDLYFIDGALAGGALYKLPNKMGPASKVTDLPYGHDFGFVYDGTNLWFDSAQQALLYKNGQAAPVSNGAVGYSVQLAKDAKYIYVANANGNVVRVPVAGGVPQIVATSAEPEGVALDDKFVYWADYQTGAVSRIAKAP